MPRDIDSIHATVIGLDDLGSSDTCGNLSQLNKMALRVGIDLPALISCMRSWVTDEPTSVQFGGFNESMYSLNSRNQRLDQRMVSIQDDVMVLIGWPVEELQQPTNYLDRLRRQLQQFGVRHRYHETDSAVDGDVYMVVGTVMPGVPATKRAEVITELRRTVLFDPTLVPLDVGTLALALYREPSIPTESTRLILFVDLDFE